MRIAVLAASAQDFNDFKKESFANKQASEIFTYVSSLHIIRGVRFDAVIKTEGAWRNPANSEIYVEIINRINYDRDDYTGNRNP